MLTSKVEINRVAQWMEENGPMSVTDVLMMLIDGQAFSNVADTLEELEDNELQVVQKLVNAELKERGL